MLRRAVVVTGILAVLSFATTARAQPGNTPPGGPVPVPPPATYVPPPTYAPPAATHTERYGTSIAAMDALAGGLVMIGALVFVSGAIGGDEDTAGVGAVLMIGGSAVYAFGPAYIHTRHDNTSSAWKSVGLRLGLPMVGALIGSALDQETCDQDGYCYNDGDETAGQLAGLGSLAAILIDWVVLAKVQVPTPAPYYPYAAPTAGGGGTFGLAGAF